MTDRPRSAQSRRGIASPPPPDRVKPYSAASYAAQYGITLDMAADMLERCETHRQVERMIFAEYKNDPGLMRRALFLDADDVELGESDRRAAERIANRMLKPV